MQLFDRDFFFCYSLNHHVNVNVFTLLSYNLLLEMNFVAIGASLPWVSNDVLNLLTESSFDTALLFNVMYHSFIFILNCIMDSK